MQPPCCHHVTCEFKARFGEKNGGGQNSNNKNLGWDVTLTKQFWGEALGSAHYLSGGRDRETFTYTPPQFSVQKPRTF